MSIIDVFDGSIEFESRIFQAAEKGFIQPPVPLLIYQQSEAFFKAELADVGLFELPANGFRHAEEFHRMKFFDGRLHQHKNSSSLLK